MAHNAAAEEAGSAKHRDGIHPPIRSLV